MSHCSTVTGSILVLVIALIARQALTPAVIWHEGPQWETFLNLYDDQVANHFGACEARQVETQFGHTQVYACGKPSGSPVVLQGGAGSSCVIYTDWILPKLVERGHFVLAVDFICDVGRSRPRDGDKANCPRTGDDLVTWLKQIVDAYKISKPVSLVGYSYGAFISATVAAKAPEMADRLVLMAPAAVFAPVTPYWIFRVLYHHLIYSGPDGFDFENWLHVDPNFDFAKNMSAHHIAFQKAIKNVSPFATTLVQPDQFPPEELKVVAAHSTLLMFGENETVFDTEVAKKYAANFPGIRVQVYKNTGHLMIIEEHRQKLEEDAVAFLSR